MLSFSSPSLPPFLLSSVYFLEPERQHLIIAGSLGFLPLALIISYPCGLTLQTSLNDRYRKYVLFSRIKLLIASF